MSYKKFYNYLKEYETYCFSKNQRVKETINKINMEIGDTQNGDKFNAKTGQIFRETRKELIESFVFKISRPLFTLLYLTDNEDDTYNSLEHKLPYDRIFIDSQLIYEDYKIEGLLVSKEVSNDGKETLGCNFLIVSEKNGLDMYLPYIDLFQKGAFDNNYWKEHTSKINFNDELRNNLRCFVLNFLNFLNNPTIEIIKSENRESYGAFAGKITKGSQEIILMGKLKIYVDRIEEQMKDVTLLKKSHWVRGHWRRFYSKRFVNKIGTKTWIYPYIAGIGDIKKKDYLLKTQEQGEIKT